MNRLPKAVLCRERGAALIIVLAFVVLLTGVGIAYFARATSDRQVAHSSFHQSNVDQLAQSAMDNIIGDLRQEITNGSTATTVNGVTIYTPTSAANMVPQRSGNAAGALNLIRRSIRLDPIPAPGRPSRASGVNSRTDASANGRAITSTRWNSHYLVPKGDTATSDSSPIPAFTAATPDWVFVTDQGATVITAPSSSVIGRYAYAIYDEGGLLDMNVAGYPNGTTPDQAGRKGPVAFADLTALPSPSPNPPSPYFPNSSSPYQIDRLVGWRNYGTTQPSNNFPDSAPPGQAFARNFQTGSGPALAYYNSVINNTSGFTSVTGAVAANGRTNQMFLSRQQLIVFRAAIQFSPNALQYLGTFFRELNAPAWKPSTPAGSTINYVTLANTPTPETSTAINRDLLTVRVSNAFTRFDGTSANVGELLVKARFPLSRLAWITYKGPSAVVYAANNSDPAITQLTAAGVPLSIIQAGTAANIKACFGLTFPAGGTAGDPWTYTNPTGAGAASRTMRLDEVAAAAREPDFFELLKAAILNGSVGVGSGPGNTFVAAEAKYYDTTNGLSADTEIMQIGANVIDQADPDKNPTFIVFGATPPAIAGTENLPYLNKIGFQCQWTTPTAFRAFLVPSFWNPAQNSAAVGTASATIPTVRFIMTSGTVSAVVEGVGSATSASVTGSSTQPSVNLTSTVNFGPSPDAALSTSVKLGMSATPDNKLGIPLTFASTGTVTRANATRAYPTINNVTFEMQAQIGGTTGPWKTYERWFGSAVNTAGITSAFTPPVGFDWGQTTIWDPEFVLLDPRTMRFGVWGNAGNQSAVATDYISGVLTNLEPSAGVFERITALPPQGARFGSPASIDLYKYANNADGTVHYTDLDQVQRQGDLLTSGATTAMLPANSADRPQILNRPFQSVAELGQVFRDQPWKTLDFTTAASADAGLLDVFTLHETSMEAGKTSLNTRQKPILTAILSQATKRLTDLPGATVITPAQRDSIVTALFTLTSAQPMVRKTELLTQLAADPSVTGLGNKEARELVMRAFSDACQTRTWNLMIDVIAQSGHYPPNASTFAGFLVEGEQHYWVHVAIDRFTGQVIDKQIEVVNE